MSSLMVLDGTVSVAAHKLPGNWQTASRILEDYYGADYTEDHSSYCSVVWRDGEQAATRFRRMLLDEEVDALVVKHNAFEGEAYMLHDVYNFLAALKRTAWYEPAVTLIGYGGSLRLRLEYGEG